MEPFDNQNGSNDIQSPPGYDQSQPSSTRSQPAYDQSQLGYAQGQPTYGQTGQAGPSYSYDQPMEPLRRVQVIPHKGVGRGAVVAALLLGTVGGGIAGSIAGRALASSNAQSATAAPAFTTPQQPAGVIACGNDAPLKLVDTNNRAVQVVKQVGPAVVTIVSSGVDPQTGASFTATGSGIIIDRTGDILTNDHVVNGGSTYTVVFNNNSKVAAMVVREDSDVDLALIHVDGPVPAYAQFGDSKQVQPGETVLAIGNPLGSYNNTVTEGIVSAVGRTIQEPSNDSNPGPNISGALQTDAAINHGNSGGPLVDLNGHVIGINTAIVRSGQGSGNGQGQGQDPFGGQNPFGGTFTIDPSSGDQAQGLGFAIPSDTARSFVDGSLRHVAPGAGSLLHVAPGYLGVYAPALDPQTASMYSLPTGAYVQQVYPNTPAARAGLQAKDIITAVDGQSIGQNHSLQTVIQGRQPGQTVRLSVFRAGRTLSITVKLAVRPASAQ